MVSEKLASKRILTGLVSCVRVFGLFLRLMGKVQAMEGNVRSVTLEDHQPPISVLEREMPGAGHQLETLKVLFGKCWPWLTSEWRWRLSGLRHSQPEAGDVGNEGREKGGSCLPSATEKVVQHKKLGVGSRSPWNVLDLRVP